MNKHNICFLSLNQFSFWVWYGFRTHHTFNIHFTTHCKVSARLATAPRRWAEICNSFIGKIDVGRYPEVGEKYHINTSALTRQLPTLILFQNGQEVGRVPAIISGKVQKFIFKEQDIIDTFDLNNLYNECKKDKKFAAKIQEHEKKEKEAAESKKDK